MARRRRAFLPTGPWLAVRGLVAVLVTGAVAVAMVGRATGVFERASDVFVGVPVSAGLITTQAPVRYHGVNVGRIAEIESSTSTSRVRLAIDDQALPMIPDSVVARVVPRTFFGDIYLQLADGSGPRSNRPLSAGSTVSIDDSAEAMALYDVFTKLVDVFSRIKPEGMQTALTAISQAIDGRGADIGATIDNLSVVADRLTPSMVQFLDATPQFRDVMESLHAATPDILDTLSSATAVSARMLDDRTGLSAALGGLSELATVLTPFLADHSDQLITVVDSAGRILATTAAQPQGLVGTLSGARAFGDAGARSFANGRFNITAVATFAGPMPYSIEDCPVYGSSLGAHCSESDIYRRAPAPLQDTPTPHLPVPTAPAADGAPGSAESAVPPLLPAEGPAPGAPVRPAAAVVGAEPEMHALAVLQDEVLGTAPGPAEQGRPNIATVVMLGPLVRGTEVRIG
ncbi:MAG: MCE family protein [Actinomycetota bacterium]|nr:MCE family protein [Actinomycetota bacterium]